MALVFAAVLGSVLTIQLRSERDRTDRFWNLLDVEGTQYTRFSSLDDMTNAATVVLVGRITDVQPGRVIVGDPEAGERGKAYYLAASLQVEEVVHGSLLGAHDRAITVELFAPSVDAVPLVLETAPRERGLFFLLNKAKHPATEGLAPAERAQEAAYYEIMGDQALLRDVDDRATLAAAVDAPDFVLALEGRSFSAVVDEVRALQR